MKLRCRILGHDTYAWRRSPSFLHPNMVLGTRCRRCGDAWSIEVPPEGLHWTVRSR